MNATVSTSKSERAEKRRQWWQRYVASMKYLFYVIFHPFDGFWDLVHEKRGTIAAANTFLALCMVTNVVELLFTNFQFIRVNLQYINLYEQCASLLLPFFIMCTANWGMTTLFDGKGRFKDIYMAMCYALMPLVLIQLPLVLVSNFITYEEAAFYDVLSSFSMIWTVFLVFVALMQVHDYGPGKTLLFLFVTLLGSLVIIFLILVFFSLLSDALGYFVSLYKEISFRLY